MSLCPAKIFKRLKEIHLKHRLLKPYVETFLAFGLNQLIEKPTKSTLFLCTVSLIDLILTNSKKVSSYSVISDEVSNHELIYCSRKTRMLKQGSITLYL